MKAYLAKDQGVDAKPLTPPTTVWTLDFSRSTATSSRSRDAERAREGKYKGTEFTRFDITKSIEKKG